MKSTIEEARSTCSGLQGLIRRLNGAAIDLDKGGETAYEILALLASTNDCVTNLSSQLHSLENTSPVTSNVSPIQPAFDKTPDRSARPTDHSPVNESTVEIVSASASR